MTPLEKGALIVVALGGNAMQAPDGDDSVEGDFSRTAVTARHLAALVAGGYRVVITHGNGPQVGNHLLRSELGRRHGNLPELPLDVCVADTEGGMGYMLQQCLGNALLEAGLPGVVVSLVTQTLVEIDDPAFGTPSKPVGELIDPARADEARAQGWLLVEDRHRHGFRRVVASPDPKEIVEAAAIAALVEDGVLVVAAGGGGIPVVHPEEGGLSGVAAVVDKDLASSLLASDLRADLLLILTDVDHVMRGYDTDAESPIETIDVAGARADLDAGEFPPGSMGPKVEAACRFVEARGRAAIITSIASAEGAVRGDAGTRVVPAG
jgi:carbamate kinase